MISIGSNTLALSLLDYVAGRGNELHYTNATEKILAAVNEQGKQVGRL